MWQALDSLRAGQIENAEQFVSQALLRYSRGYQPRALQGFLAMEAGDWIKAVYYWQEAGRLSYTAMQRGYFFYLQGRAMEMQGDYQKAIGLYKMSGKECPKWMDPEYRQGVCMVKMGFADQGMSLFTILMRAEPAVFNRILMDPELERGRIHVLSGLWRPWTEAGEAAAQALEGLSALSGSLAIHFPPEDAYSRRHRPNPGIRHNRGVKNYVASRRWCRGSKPCATTSRPRWKKRYQHPVGAGPIRELKNIQREAAWFPFPSCCGISTGIQLLRRKLNWMRTTILRVPENFRKSQEALPLVDESIKTCGPDGQSAHRARFDILRHASGRNFMWMEIAGLALALVLVPLFVYGLQHSDIGHGRHGGTPEMAIAKRAWSWSWHHGHGPCGHQDRRSPSREKKTLFKWPTKASCQRKKRKNKERHPKQIAPAPKRPCRPTEREERPPSGENNDPQDLKIPAICAAKQTDSAKAEKKAGETSPPSLNR